jgi:hypothetical protein
VFALPCFLPSLVPISTHRFITDSAAAHEEIRHSQVGGVTLLGAKYLMNRFNVNAECAF